MSEDVLSQARIFIFQQRGWAVSIGHGLARNLHARGAKLATLTMKRSTDTWIRNQSEIPYESIWSDEDIEESPESFLEEFSPTLSEVCSGLGIDTVWQIVQSRRTQVRSYGEGFYYKYRQNVPDEHIENYVKAMYVVCKKVMDEFKPDAIVAPIFGGLPHIMFNLMARKHGVPMIGVTDTKIYGISVFTHSYLNDASPFVDRIDQLNDSEQHSQHSERAREYIEAARSQFRTSREMERLLASRRKSIFRRLRALLGELRYSRNSPNHVKGLGPSVDARSSRIVLRDFLRSWQYERFADRLPMTELDQNREYAFFPLQTQPEAAIDIFSARFNNQIETARQLAMSLPGDMKLVAKDHPGMRGRRPGRYLDKLARTPNVLLVNSDASSADLIRKSKVIVTSAGTISMEAALLKVPVIQLGDLGTTLRLPNVTQHSDLSTITKVIKRVKTANFETSEYEQRLENYVAAAYDVGFSADYLLAWERNDADESKAIIGLFTRELERCLSGE